MNITLWEDMSLVFVDCTTSTSEGTIPNTGGRKDVAETYVQTAWPSHPDPLWQYTMHNKYRAGLKSAFYSHNIIVDVKYTNCQNMH